jgi:hypothetical protein
VARRERCRSRRSPRAVGGDPSRAKNGRVESCDQRGGRLTATATGRHRGRAETASRQAKTRRSVRAAHAAASEAGVIGHEVARVEAVGAAT